MPESPEACEASRTEHTPPAEHTSSTPSPSPTPAPSAAGPGSVSGPAEFSFVGGRACLDFVATLARRYGQPLERLATPAALTRWFQAAGLCAPHEQARVGPEELRAALELREAVYRLVRAVALDATVPEQADLALVNRAAARPDLTPQLAWPTSVRWQGAGDGAGHAEVPGEAYAYAALATIARDAVLMLGGPLAGRVKECQGPTCALLFLDDSQGSRRRWCSMDRCGNLAKISGYRARSRATGPDVTRR